ncbi:MAG: MFS transporter [Ruminococcaceae bacterium]|nr:MFS transporter [Oscillospiraceae bacterium]
MKTKLSPKFWLSLTIFSFIGQVAWVVENMYFNVFIYKMFNASVSDISLMVGASAVAATLTTIFIGAMSDKIGKRKIFMCLGYILWGISILSFVFIRKDVITSLLGYTVNAASIGISAVIILDCVMTFFGSSANDAAFNAWLTDSTDSSNRGSAEGLNSMMPLVAILAVFGGFMAFNLDLPESWITIYAIIGGLVILVGVLGFFIIEEKQYAPIDMGYFKGLIYGFLPKTVIQNKKFYLTLLAFTVFNISIQIFMPYLIIYYEVSLEMTNYVLVMAPAIILASVFTFFWGKIYDKRGFSFSSFISLGLLFIGYILLYIFKSTIPVFVGSLFMMCGYLSGIGVFGAMIRDLTPENKSGMFQGIRIVAQVLIPGIVGPYIGKTVLANARIITNSDGTTSFVPNENIFIAALAVGLITFVLTIFLTSGTTKQTPTA